ncbi:isopenicillin-N N-acyltransferase-like protein [Brevibacterium sanguinis]|uniref:Isopenicillin-N N-acyltransferase-like protein n=2 Tax=Brevibacterium TaxID=1696 RepID=A0A366IG66_9MICO|nr:MULTISPECIES: C45 family peptidase [Brevibacterium]RBP62010.1 isopenicillin-N N-acyltransferase-like protein [Brevibacterium sanguinis]RBP70568.1 isopenicillin-N N-acyltransferase-like protein [Brevibacterium celere]
MTLTTVERKHLVLTGATHRELGSARGRALRDELPGAYAKYSELFRLLGIDPEAEAAAVATVLATVGRWRPEIVDELTGIAEAAGLDLACIVALNARTEILALSRKPSHECSTFSRVIDGKRCGVQTWDWHVELDPYWHIQSVEGPGHRFAGLTEHGILSKIGVNSAGLAVHFNFLQHEEDSADGVPVHLLQRVLLSECASVAEAIDLIRSTPIHSSSAFTLIDAERAASVEVSPVGVFVIDETEGSVLRTNHFQDPLPLSRQKPEIDESESVERFALVRERLEAHPPASTAEMVALLQTAPDQAPLTCIPDMSLGFGDRWASLATIITEPTDRRISILSGAPTELSTGQWQVLEVGEPIAG